MTATTKTTVEMPRDVLKALDAMCEYTAYDEAKDYAGERPGDHIWLSIKRVLEWRVTLPGAGRNNARGMVADGMEWEQAAAEHEAA
jgi:hypothetical protein